MARFVTSAHPMSQSIVASRAGAMFVGAPIPPMGAPQHGAAPPRLGAFYGPTPGFSGARAPLGAAVDPLGGGELAALERALARLGAPAASRDPKRRLSVSAMRKLAAKPSADTKLPVAMLLALSRRESGFRPYITGPAPHNAIGLMQLLPSTARGLARTVGAPAKYQGKPDYYDPPWNVKAGARYFADQLRGFKDVRDTLVAYVAGPGKAKPWGGYWGRWEKVAGGVKFRRAPPKVRKYVDDILANYATYGGSAAWLKANTTKTKRPPKPTGAPVVEPPAPLVAATSTSGDGDGFALLAFGGLLALILAGGFA